MLRLGCRVERMIDYDIVVRVEAVVQCAAEQSEDDSEEE
jgi:hypothetical protein